MLFLLDNAPFRLRPGVDYVACTVRTSREGIVRPFFRVVFGCGSFRP